MDLRSSPGPSGGNNPSTRSYRSEPARLAWRWLARSRRTSIASTGACARLCRRSYQLAWRRPDGVRHPRPHFRKLAVVRVAACLRIAGNQFTRALRTVLGHEVMGNLRDAVLHGVPPRFDALIQLARSPQPA